jgi:peroxiredoxin Q/BCP
MEMDVHDGWIGKNFPNFNLINDYGELLKLSDIKGQWSVLFFYPKDGSPGCTIESCAFRDRYDEIVEAGGNLYGISSDSMQTHQNFRKKHNLQYTLLTDSKSQLVRKMKLKRTFGILRTRVTFIVDPEGIVRGVVTSQFNPYKHIEYSLKILMSKDEQIIH